MLNRCRCCGVSLRGSDHCWKCFCEQFEERCEWRNPDGEPHFMFRLAEKMAEIEAIMNDWEVENEGE